MPPTTSQSVPDVEASRELESEISELLEEKDLLQAEQNSIALRLAEVDRKIGEAQARLGAISNRQLPLLNLPPEVTCTIFDYASEPTTSQKGRALSEQWLGEVVVSHVCSQWRAIALTYSRIWSRFSYDAENTSRVPIDRLQTYLERSNSRLLDLRFRLEGRVSLGVEETKQAECLLGMAMDHVARWKRMTVLSGESTSFFDLMASALANASAPNLEYFAVSSASDYNEDIDPTFGLSPTIFKGGAPKLKYVLLSDFIAYTCRPPLSNVSTLRIEMLDAADDFPFGWSDFQELLKLPFLENFSVAGMFSDVPDLRHVGLITMKNLKHLRCSQNEDLTRLLPFIRAPALETLILHEQVFPDDFGDQPLVRKDRYTFPSLRSVSLVLCTSPSPRAFRYFTEITGSITEITFSAAEYDDGFFYTLMNNSKLKQDTYWTKLKRVTFNIAELDQHLNGDVFRFARGRSKNGLIVRIPDCMGYDPRRHAKLAQICTVELYPSNDIWSIHGHWPSGECDLASRDAFDEDPFHIGDIFERF